MDARVQEKLYTTIRDLASAHGYMAGAGTIMDVETGELLALTSFPEYESGVISDGTNKKLIQSYNLDKRAVYLDRAVSGIYTPGSIVKPFMAIAALNEGVITPEKQILSTGSISVQNPYNTEIDPVLKICLVQGLFLCKTPITQHSNQYLMTGRRTVGWICDALLQYHLMCIFMK